MACNVWFGIVAGAITICGALFWVCRLFWRSWQRNRDTTTIIATQDSTVNITNISIEKAIFVFPPYVNGLPESQNDEVKELFEKGLSQRREGKYEGALQLFRKALTIDVCQEEKVALLLLIGGCFFEQYQLPEAEGNFKEAERIASDTNEYLGLAATKTMLGFVALSKSDLSNAIQYKDEAFTTLGAIADENPGMWAIKAVAHGLDGYIYQAEYEAHPNKDILKKAKDRHTKSLDLSKKTGMPLIEVEALIGIAWVYRLSREWDKVKYYLESALEILRPIDWRFAEGGLLVMLSDVYKFKGNKPQAIDLLYKALDKFVEIGNKVLEEAVIERIADIESEEQ